MFQVFCYAEMQTYNEYANKEENKCRKLLEDYLQNDDNQTTSSCPPHFDGSYCWPATSSLSLAEIPCPLEDYQNETMSRWCSANTTVIAPGNITAHQWHEARYGECSLIQRGKAAPAFAARSGDIISLFTMAFHTENDSYFDWWHEKLSILDQIGYALSILFLVSALSIFATFTQLQDTRVKVHINLFIAMLLQSLMSLIQNFFYGCKIYYTILVSKAYESSAICRILMTFGHYFELTIFSWLLIEGWYFYSFISRAPYKDYITIKPHILAGWGLPLIVIIPWIIVHLYSAQTNFCWVDLDIKINIVAIPILLIVLINLCFFILNVRIIFIKMRNTYTTQRRMHYWRWIKSSLMLVPLFGTYDVLYGIWPWIEDQQVKIVFLLIVRLICSFQGCIVAALYCFANGEVKREVRRAWHNWKLKREINSKASRTRYHSTETLNKIGLTDTPHSSNSNLKFADVHTYF